MKSYSFSLKMVSTLPNYMWLLPIQISDHTVSSFWFQFPVQMTNWQVSEVFKIKWEGWGFFLVQVQYKFRAPVQKVYKSIL